MNAIDFVIPWVDGSDPAWQAQRAAYSQESHSSRVAAQYRDWGTLKYWFRGVEKYAPWVNRIHFVTCGQKPEWLNVHHPKLHLVTHGDYMPKEYLPTFSANPIELNLHRIEGLSEQFVYFNDDTFLTSMVKKDDFFWRGLPRDAALFSSLIPSVREDAITYILFNDLMMINSNFDKRSALKGHLKKWVHPCYGKGVFRNLYYMPIGKFPGFVNPHLPNSFLKSSFEEIWTVEGEALDGVCRNRFRSTRDVNQYLMRYWQLVTGRFLPRSPGIGACYTLGVDDDRIRHALLHGDCRMVCINDNPLLESIDAQKEALLAAFEAAFPQKCSFEV